MNKKIPALLGAMVLTAVLLTGCGGDASSKVTFTGDSQGYRVANAFLSGRPRLTNRIDGYSLTLPEGAVVDTSLSAIRTVVSYGGVQLFIYAEDVTGSTQGEYINYSDTFLTSGWGVTVTNGVVLNIGGCETECNSWTRTPLANVEDDRTNYSCFDIKKDGDKVYTLMFKFPDGTDYDRDILNVARTFRAGGGGAEPPSVRVGEGEGPAMNDETRRAYDRLFGPSSGLDWGCFFPNMNKPEEVAALEEKLDYDFGAYLFYTGFKTNPEGYPEVFGERLSDFLIKSCPDGQVPELTLQTEPIESYGVMVYDVLNGVYDEFLHNYAKEVKRFGGPVLFRLCNEMNGDWCSYSAFATCRDPEIFKYFYRYIFGIFQSEGVDNAIWVFNPNGRSLPPFKWNHELLYYPGDEYVNVVGMTAYNTGTYYSGEVWSGFNELYSDLYADYTERYAQPLMITEFACSGVGGDKAAWIDDMFKSLPSYPKLKLAVWWNSFDTDYAKNTVARPYMLDETPETTEAFKRGLAAYKK